MCGGLFEMKIMTSLFLFFALIDQSFATNKIFRCDGEISDYAKELILEEFAGKRSDKDNHCLKQEHFKYIRPVHDPINEITSAESFIVDEKSLNIQKVEKLDSVVGTYRVTFTVVVSGHEKNVSKKTHPDSLIFLLDNDPKWGCAQTLSSPKAILLKSACQ